MSDQLSAQDWLDQGLKTLAKSGFTALKAEPLAKAMGVSRGSFYWHFADISAFHAAILKHWREIAAEQIIADVEAASGDENPLAVLLRRVFGERLTLESAVRTWASVDPAARAAVQAIDRRRLGYVESLLTQSGLSGRRRPRPRANSLLGVSRLCAVGPAAAESAASRPCSTKCCGSRRRDDTSAVGYAKDAAKPETPHEFLARTPRRHRRPETAGDPGVPGDQGPAGVRQLRGRN